MNRERFQQIESIFQAALKRDPASRASFLDGACLNDEELRREVESLLAAHDEGGSFIHAPAVEVAAQLMAEEQVHALTTQSLRPYKIISRIGAGGMGGVYLGQDNKPGRNIALKLLPDFLPEDEEQLSRFKRDPSCAAPIFRHNFGANEPYTDGFSAPSFFRATSCPAFSILKKCF